MLLHADRRRPRLDLAVELMMLTISGAEVLLVWPRVVKGLPTSKHVNVTDRRLRSRHMVLPATPRTRAAAAVRSGGRRRRMHA